VKTGETMTILPAGEKNLSMIAFRHHKPDILTSFVGRVKARTELALKSVGANEPIWYSEEQVHATIIGAEVVRIAGKIYNANWLNNRGVLRAPDALGFCEFVREVGRIRPDGLLFNVRFCGFRTAHCHCSGFALGNWACESGGEFHSCDRSPYEGSFYAYPSGPIILTGWPIAGTFQFPRTLFGIRPAAENFNLLDKYHGLEKSHWMDDDFYIRLGTLRSIPHDDVVAVEAEMRQWLSEEAEMRCPVHLDDVSVVLYEDTQLKRIRHAYSISELVSNPSLLPQLYDQI
jgi:hypothetical protein